MRLIARVLVTAVSLVATVFAASTERIGPLNPAGLMVPDGSEETSVATDSNGNCFVAFKGITEINQSSIYFVTIPPNGAAGRPQALSPTRSGSPSLGPTGQNVHLAWLEAVEKRKFRVGYRQSTDQGANWSQPAYVDAGASARRITLTGGPGDTLFILFLSSAGPNQPDTIWCYRRANEEGGWQRQFPEEQVGGMLSEVSPIAGSKSLDLVWTETRPQGFKIMFNRSCEGEKGWLPQPVTVYESVLPVSQLQLIPSGDGLVLFWKETAAEGDRIRVTSSEDGSRWKTPAEIDSKWVRELTYQASVRDDNAHVISVEETDAGPERRFQFKVNKVEISTLQESEGGVGRAVTTWTHTYLYRPDFMTATEGKELLIVALVREPTNRSSLFLITPTRPGSGSVVAIAPEDREINRTLIAVVGLSSGAGVVYRQQPRPRLLEQVLPGELMFARVPLTK